MNLSAWYMKRRKGKWKVKEQAAFITKLGELLDNGYPLAEAIGFLEFQEAKNKREDFGEAIRSLRDGHPLHQVLSDLKFHPELVSFIFYGEQYGNLAHSLTEGGKYWRKRTEDTEKLKKLLVYPLFLFFFVGMVFYILQVVLLPKFQTIFLTMNMEQSLLLKVLSASAVLLPFSPFLLLTFIITLVAYKQFWFKKLCPLRQRRILLKIPLAGTFIRLYETYFFASQFGGLLAGGLSINESIQLFSLNQQQPFYQKLCAIMKDDLTEGRPLEMIFQELPYFEGNLPFVTANGQKYGRLDSELHHYSQFLLQRIEERMRAVMKVIQPLLFSLIGLLIVSIYLAVLLPMFSLLDGI